MRLNSRTLMSLCIAAIIHGLPGAALAEDIDIFTGTNSSASAANILIVLDNTSNWSSVSEQFAGGITKGQAEVQAIQALVATLKGNTAVNLGLMVLSPAGTGGMMVFPTAPVSTTNIDAWNKWTNDRYNNITDSAWKASSNANYGGALFDVFKYFGGYTNPTHAFDNVAGTPLDSTHYGVKRYGTLTPNADPSSYTLDQSSYIPPTVTPCNNNYIIFIGNGFPNADDPALLANVSASSDMSAAASSAAIAAVQTPVTPNIMDGGGKVYLADEWARFLYNTDVNGFAGQQKIVTYTIDVVGSKLPPDAPKQAQLLANMAAFGGTAFSANSVQKLTDSLKQITTEIQAVNGTFSSASLPVNTTNRSQDKNQIFIPMFRPDADARPRWMGNLKQYQLVNISGVTQLGDATGAPAVNRQSGFVTDCALSYWTTDSGNYWANVPENPSPRSSCTTATTNAFSDAPDGPTVEKGGAAEMLRTRTTARNVYTLSSANLLTSFTSVSTGLSSSLVNFMIGQDTQDENVNGNTTEARPSMHGDAIHSRPLPVDYGTTGSVYSGVAVFYGANDGTLRAINSGTGAELWAFIAPEFNSKLQRLQSNSPLLRTSAGIAGTTPKDYFFDGSIGVYQTANNSRVWIYPSMRRGGRMVYGLNVTDPTSPQFMWKVGCPNLADDVGCTPGMGSGFNPVGQTWSKPAVAASAYGNVGRPVVIMGGGYDGGYNSTTGFVCDDQDTKSPSCNTGRGAAVYVLDAATGAILNNFQLNNKRGVAADIALYSSANDGVVDILYAVDTGGSIYRINLRNNAVTQVSYTSGAGRKFLYPPALLQGPNQKVFLALGSGDREHPLIGNYPYTQVENRFYVFVDDLASTSATNLDDPSKMRDLSSSDCGTVDVSLTNANDKGWFIRLNKQGQGEQTVTSALIAAGLVSFSTNRPVAPAANSCSATLGEARGYWLNLFNGAGAIGTTGACGGTQSSIFQGGGLPPSPVIGIVPVNIMKNGVVTGTQIETVVIGAVQRDGSQSTSISPQEIKPTVKAKRKIIYWKSSGIN